MLVSFQKVSLRLGEKEVLRDFSLDLQNKGIYLSLIHISQMSRVYS